jgi:DNA modification methylase
MSATLLQGDCLEVLRGMADESISCVITDPPYKISQTYTANVDADNLAAVSAIWPMSQEAFRLCVPGAYMAMFYDTGWKYLRNLTFYRRWGAANKLYGWMSTSDFVLIFRKPSDTPFQFYSTDWRHDVIMKDKPEPDGFNHPAQKPVGDVAHLVNHLAPADGVVLDPFMGSGTTGVACMKMGRRFVGIEIDKGYHAIAQRRIAEAQMQMPLLELAV